MFYHFVCVSEGSEEAKASVLGWEPSRSRARWPSPHTAGAEDQ